jgi:predicted nucleic acid-binding protein
VTAILDVSFLVAAADASDINHGAARAWLRRVDEPLAVCALTLGEADLVLQAALGAAATLALLESIVRGQVRLVAPADADLERAADLVREHAEHRPRLADALLVAAAERVRATRIATFDRRPLAVLRAPGSRGIPLEP